MSSSKNKMTRKSFLSNLLKGGVITGLFIGSPLSKLLGITKNKKIYFRENPNSVKRQK